MTYYFESKENFDKFASGPMPPMDGGMKMHEMKGGMMMQEEKNGATKSVDPAPSSKNDENHQQHH